jgi:T4 bacteriophage base plate protein
MALPKIKHPTYNVTIPSNKQKVNIRPFTVQEEKLLLMARQSENAEDSINTIKQIITNCVIESIDVDKLATFDIEYLFVKLRAKSVGEIVELEYKDTETNESIKFKVNLDDVEIKYNPNHTNKFIISGEVGVSMRYPSISELKQIENDMIADKTITGILSKCIDKIFDNDNVYTDYTDSELEEFINSLPVEAMTKIREFFETMPSLEYTTKVKNKAGKEIDVELRGINNFFTY